ncbi:hypothetical protein A3C09_01470 [Candidatus Uhrbacteria bacterium RIFCSPHIGHO2_02_FULL_47_44]|uniref:PPM-type phosphatase domain-containing protein n=1 Tax=Candidatus Uhrbacteria bacterium RIFCSPLOWO2_02_FULL_48_18 TaxID=1802408 RepID=A0A1F7VA39_9BACT|nr:MAG: hypothetical protein A2839_02350 [Candidatus Uhrbacteria bacterium RIFCSPHIGHO2_01_FULL_47_10]OGL69834.1 MAG: hypothetical protein A3C09_01470 [Candidatus Uhrbacteria bacterium RIFCSPHIGHO2_02_FULL_47_44]OGL77454.1 MAG: hypothetical protein A3E97_00530 [Candidatus Uhrbacteria bacterium RIFCSPHIGHO2_12_FULL_47_12]OGL81815.1 MAG: hypothetical protein A3B20_01835 [Candidatus Uhrbacteria bacterium RIFCSPLOWO2_01_FULL_47_17]OGL86978.1 MAG: hypothetical protein A3I41_03425 [Candidatus Uhrbact
MVPYLKAAQYEPKSPNEHVEGLSVMLPLEGRSGYVFVLAYLGKKNPDNEVLLQLLSDHVHRLASSFGKDANAQHRFEQFLGALNETVSQTVRDGRFHIPIHFFHAAVGIICDDRMFLSGTGELSALFLHRKPTQRYQVFNLFRGIQTEQALPTWEKPFAVVLDGDLEDGDVFCVSQKDIQHQIPQDDLNSILTSLPPKSATEKIRQYFAANDGLLLLIIKAESSISSVPESYAKPLSDVSIDSFVRGQDETSKLLEDQKPDLIGFLKTHLNLLYKKLTERSRILSDLRRGEPRLKILLNITHSLSHNIWKTLRRTVKGLSFAAVTLVNKERRNAAWKSLPTLKTHLNQWARTCMHAYRALPVRTRRFAQIGLILVFVLGIGLTSLAQFRKTSEGQKQFTERVSLIQDTIDRAGGAMIYKDENQARSLYQQATTLIQQLPTDKPAQQETIEKLMKDIETAMNELRHVVTIPSPALVATIKTQTGEEQKGVKIIRSGSLLYVIDDHQAVWKINSPAKTIEAFSGGLIVSPTPILDASEDGGHIFALNTSDQLLDIDTKGGTVTPVSLTMPSTSQSISLLAYANRMYVLRRTADSQDAEILKSTKSGSAYSTGTSWISSKTKALTDPHAFTIDGSIYVLHGAGNISRFQNGAEVGWQLGIVEPSATEPTRIWTDGTSKFIYVLEPKTRRVIVYKKDTGAFVVQYTSETFTELTDFVVDETSQTIYLLSGANIYTISSGHLKI